MDAALKTKVESSCTVAENFTKLYYETLDKRRQVVSRLYLETGILTWNGNGITGNDNIQKFYIDFPTSSHTVSTLDAQPILDTAVNGQITYLIQVSGNVKYGDKIPKSFQQSFVVTAQGEKWKIVSDCFRLQEPLNSSDD